MNKFYNPSSTLYCHTACSSSGNRYNHLQAASLEPLFRALLLFQTSALWILSCKLRGGRQPPALCKEGKDKQEPSKPSSHRPNLEGVRYGSKHSKNRQRKQKEEKRGGNKETNAKIPCGRGRRAACCCQEEAGTPSGDLHHLLQWWRMLHFQIPCSRIASSITFSSNRLQLCTLN